MQSFQHHPDGWIIIRDKDKVYLDTVENFIADLGEDYIFLGTERLYQPGVRHFIDGNQPQALQWAEGDAHIAAIDQLLIAKDARENPPPTAEEQEAQKEKRIEELQDDLARARAAKDAVAILITEEELPAEAIVRWQEKEDKIKTDLATISAIEIK